MTQATGAQTRKTVVRDSTSADSIGRLTAVRRAVTPALLASAFRDSTARDLFMRARTTRVRQDSTIQSYDARVTQRLSVKAAIGRIPLERLAYRQENAARVRWQRGIGAHIDVTGARVAIPAIGLASVEREALEGAAADPDLVPIPYYPGYEPLWIGFTAGQQVNERDIVNPIADGAEAYYTYRSGETIELRITPTRTLHLRQIDIRPRQAAVNVIVGSLWIDEESGQVVRAAYRLASQGESAVSVTDSAGNTPLWAKILIKMLSPKMSAHITAIVVEYYMVDGFWLPRSQMVEGYVAASFARVPVSIENKFTFDHVDAASALAEIHVDTMAARDTTRVHGKRGSILQCDTASERIVTMQKPGHPAVQMRVPCDLDKLSRSPDLPASIFDSGEEVFGTKDREQAIREALTLADQSPFSLFIMPKPHVDYGLSLTRYNRIEGFSTGVLVDQQLGGGYDVAASGRIGTADRRARFELSAGRSNQSKTIRIGVYDRLRAATDWEDPFSFGSSLSAFFFAGDNAFYYRTAGAELTYTTRRGVRIDWRLFHEQHRAADPRAEFSVSGSFLPNIVSSVDRYSGASVQWQTSHGLDPRAFRVTTDLRLEAAHGDSSYGRGALDVTLSRSLGSALDASLSIGGGSSVGALPIERHWFLGGTQTVRGQRADTAQHGNAYWLGRAELARPMHWLRASVFGDVGWNGDRDRLANIGRPMSGVGVGLSFLDGALRFDVARGLYPQKQLQLSLYLGARF